MKTTTDAQLTRALLDALSVRYAEPEWFVWEEITLDGLGRADALAVGAYESSGHPIHGFEVKASRRDWVREMERMGKSNAAFVYCDRWFLVTVPGVVRTGDLPRGWGLLELHGEHLRIKVKALPLTPTKELTLTHMLRMARRVRRQEERDLNAEFERGVELGQSLAKREPMGTVIDRGRLARLDEFEADLGQRIDSFDAKGLASAVKFAMEQDEALRRTVRTARWQATKLLEETAWVDE